ncbi:hypothetical protein AB9F29_21050 [Falsihalocynthiibacter sp. S25ZX9]|uniref:hypothetical protein n=1 Tax=Falsihalocynthiibacter sp. S25ZX9 TaxID=3240870 RepID=UPI00351071D8
MLETVLAHPYKVSNQNGGIMNKLAFPSVAAGIIITLKVFFEEQISALPDWVKLLFPLVVFGSLVAIAIYFIFPDWKESSNEKIEKMGAPKTDQVIHPSKNEVSDKGQDFLDRLNRIDSVDATYVHSLMQLTDEVFEKILGKYSQYKRFDSHNVEVFCVSIVVTAVMVSDLPEKERLEIVDIYLGLVAHNIGVRTNGIDENLLRAEMKSVCAGYLAPIVNIAASLDFKDDEAYKLVCTVDGIAGVERDEIDRRLASVVFKATAFDVIRFVGGLTDTSPTNSI